VVESNVEVLRTARIFQALSIESLARVAEKVRRRHFLPGTPLMRQGEASDAMYVVAEGRVRVERADDASGQPAVLAELGAGAVVGEMGVLDRQPRSATVAAITAVDALELGAAPLTDIMVHHPEVAEALRHIVSERLRDADALVARMFADILARVAILQPVSPEALSHLAERGQRRHFVAGQALMRQGEPSQSMHVIAGGKVRVERSHRDIKEPVVLAHLGAGEIVGEMGVLDEAPRSATVVAVNEVETMELDAAGLSGAMLRYPEIASALLHVVTKRMRSTDALLDELISRGHEPGPNGTSNEPARARVPARDGPGRPRGSGGA